MLCMGVTCYILRHAEKEGGDFFSPRLRHQDQPISQRGRLQGKRLAPYFLQRRIDAIYVSEYQRTWQTIEAVAEQRELAPIIDSRLNEIDNGRLDGMDAATVQQEYPELWRAIVARSADYRFPDGETGAEALQRIVSFVEEKRRQHSGENILVVSHDGLIRQFMCHLFDLPVFLRADFRVDLCGLMEITYQPDYGSWKLIHFNQVFDGV